MIKCRTCLELVDECTSVNIKKECIFGRTIKDILLLFIPGMVTSPFVSELICCKCTRQIQNFTNFIQKCQNIEKLLIEQNTKKRKSTPLSNGNVNSTPLGLDDQTGTENGLQLQAMPMDLLLSPANNCTNNFDDIMTMDQICDPNVFPKKPVELEALSQLEQADLQNSTSINTFCTTCGDVFISDNCNTVQCSKCRNIKKEMDLDLSDTQSDHFDDEVDDKELVTTVEKYSTDKKGDTNVTQPNNISLVKEVDVVRTDRVFKKIRGQFRDAVVTLRLPSEQIPGYLEGFSKSNINVVEYGPFDLTGNKRVVLLGNPTTQCEECKALIKNPKMFRNHLQKCHTRQELNSDEEEEDEDVEDTGTYPCPFCVTTMGDALALVQHLQQMHKVENPFRCEKCGKTFRRRDTYQDHLNRYENSPVCFMKKCRYCDEMLSREDVEGHLRGHGHIICDKCGKSMSIYKFKAHYSTHDENFKTPKGELCPYCGKVLLNKQSWKQHVMTHGHQTRDYICHMCPKTFIRSSSLRVHIASAHSEKSYDCPLCDVKVKSKSALLSHHNLKHSETFAHVCNICGEGFSRGDYFTRHMLKHAGPAPGVHLKGKKKYNYSVKLDPRPVKCKYCLKEFKHVYTLRSHLLSHVKSIRYKCKLCDMTFANCATRRRHQKRHADPDFDLTCPVCWKRMVNKEKLEAHLALHEQSKRYLCSVCDQLFNSKFHLKHHITKEHIPKEEVEKEKQTVLRDALEEFLL